MTPQESLYYAIGELAYAVAKADGQVQNEERKKFLGIVSEELEKHNHGYDIAAIIFQVMDKQHASLPDVYHWAVHEIKTNSHYLSPALKQSMKTVMQKVAEAFLPVTHSERNLIERFVREIDPLKGDPAFYQ